MTKKERKEGTNEGRKGRRGAELGSRSMREGKVVVGSGGC